MAFLIGGANSAADTGFSVANSCRFNDGSSDDLTRTQDSTNPTNGYKYSFSTWIKRGALGAVMTLLGNYKADNEVGYIHFNANDFLEVYDFQGSGPDLNYTTDMKFKDISSWYNIVVSVDGTRSANARCKIYVNGSQVTCSSTVDTGGLLGIQYADATNGLRIGSRGSSGGTIGYLDGYMAETIYIDGEGLAPTDFGEFNSDSPTIWQPIDVSGLTFGNNGFYLDYEDSSALGADVSGNSNNLTVNNLVAVDQCTDTPTLNYMTLNPLAAGVGDTARIPTFSEGNTKFTAAGSNTFYQAISTFGVAVGKWYFEVKVASDQDLDKLRVGYWNIDKNVTSGEIQDVSAANSHVFYMNKDGGEMRLNTSVTTADYGTFADNELMGVAIDMDAQTITILKANSVIVNAYDYSGGIAAGTVLTPAFMGYDDTAFQVNFGNPHEANSSDAADGNGHGAFEFAPPSGYFAFNSSNLGKYGG
tara:strand:- start:35 stop:1456 length:1422 start_codon:yes stop_codon:yes gene_type:complete